MTTANERDPWPGILLICIALGFLFLVGAAAVTKLRPDPQPQGAANRPGKRHVHFTKQSSCCGRDDAWGQCPRRVALSAPDFQPPARCCADSRASRVIVSGLALARLAGQGPVAAEAAPLATRQTAFASRQAEVVAG